MFQFLFRLLFFCVFFLVAGLYAKAQVCISPGKDGSPTTNTATVNTYYPGSGIVAAGSTTLTLGTSTGSTTPINKGDLVLIIQMQGADISATNTAAYGAGTTT